MHAALHAVCAGLVTSLALSLSLFNVMACTQFSVVRFAASTHLERSREVRKEGRRLRSRGVHQ
jgi:hypothetical protein